MNRKLSQRRKERRGFVLAAVLLGLAVASMLLTSMARSTYISRQYLRLQSHHNQAYWLCEAGLERAVHAIRSNADYQGETWTVSSEQLGSHLSGEAVIVVAVVDNGQVSVSVTARFPTTHPGATQCTKTIFVDGPRGSSQLPDDSN